MYALLATKAPPGAKTPEYNTLSTVPTDTIGLGLIGLSVVLLLIVGVLFLRGKLK